LVLATKNHVNRPIVDDSGKVSPEKGHTFFGFIFEASGVPLFFLGFLRSNRILDLFSLGMIRNRSGESRFWSSRFSGRLLSSIKSIESS